jgi:hypothetical protein
MKTVIVTLVTLLFAISSFADTTPAFPFRTIIFDENGTGVQCTITKLVEGKFLWIIPSSGSGGWWPTKKLHPLSRVALGLGTESDKEVYAEWKAEQDRIRAEEIQREKERREAEIARIERKAAQAEAARKDEALAIQKEQLRALQLLNQKMDDQRIYQEAMRARAENRPYFIDSATAARIFRP